MATDPSQVPAIVKAIEPLITKYGYFGVGGLLLLEDFGIPVPGETVLIAASFYAGLGNLNIFIVVLVGFLGAVIGDNIGFAIGRYGGHPLVEKFGRYIFLTPQRITSAEKFFNKHGGKIIVIARFISGLRQANGIIAGLSEMHWARFVFFNIIGAAIWVSFWAAVGYLGGNNISTFLRYQLYISLFIVTCLLIFGAYKYNQKRTLSKNDKKT